MKKILLPLIAVACVVMSVTVQAQKRGEVVMEVLPAGNTTVRVKVIAEKESVRSGPYARFAQKYLGVIAPMSNKDSYRIVEADIFASTDVDFYYRDHYYPDTALQVASNAQSDTTFVKVNIDRSTTVEQSAETMAQHAAETIFMLRKRRIELVTGDAGENVFGAGLSDALAEINRLENEYLALFMGKQFRQRVVRVYDITPEKGRNTETICRFTETGGIVPASDLSGRPVILDLSLDKPAASSAVADRRNVSYQTLEMVNLRLLEGTTELAARRIKIPQMATTVEVY